MGGIGSFQVWVSQLSQPLSYLEESFFLVSALEIKGMNIEDLDGSDFCSENHIIKRLPARLDKAPLGIEAFFLSVWRRLKSGAFLSESRDRALRECLRVTKQDSDRAELWGRGDGQPALSHRFRALSPGGSGDCPQVKTIHAMKVSLLSVPPRATQ